VDPLSGKVYGKFDPRFTGHAPFCPTALYQGITSAEGIRDQQCAIHAWAGMAREAAMPGWPEIWRGMSWALMLRADALGVEYPVPDDTRELAVR
jgi:hypothetical protein